jgi:hypothetical protein
VAPTVRSEQSNASNTADMVFTLAASTTVGDLAVVIAANDFYTLANIQTPTGTAVSSWTLQSAATVDTGSNGNHVKVWTGPVTTGGTSTIDTNWSTLDEERYAQILIIQDGAFDVALSATNATTTTSFVAPSVTTTGTDDLLICSWGEAFAGSAFNLTPQGSMTELTERDIASCTFTSATETLVASGATGTRTATASTSKANSWGVSVAIKSAGGGASVTKQETRIRNRARLNRAFNW